MTRVWRSSRLAPAGRCTQTGQPQEDLDQITVGVDTPETVASAIGRPSTAGVLTDSGWYYVESRFRAYGVRERKEIEREVVAIDDA